MSDGMTDAYRSIISTRFAQKDITFTCKECGAQTDSENSWYDGKKHYVACDVCYERIMHIDPRRKKGMKK